MKKYIKIIAFALIAAIVLSCPSFAADNTDYADTLYELCFFKGTDNGYELEKTFTREEAATILVRLLGEEKNLNDKAYDEVFTDVLSDRWSFSYVMYCYENEIIKGTDDNIFSPESPITAEEFVTLVLRLVGYTYIEPENALEQSIYVGLLNSEVVRDFESADKFLRNDMVYVVYRSLMTKSADGKILADILAEKGAITEAEAKEFDVYNDSADIDELLDRLLN